MKFFIKVIKNKYVLSIVALALWLLYFDKNDIFTQMELKDQLNKLNKESKYYSTEIARNKQELKDLQTDLKSMEKFAREKYHMKKDNEDVFVIVKE